MSRTAPLASRPMFEGLEARSLLSATPVLGPTTPPSTGVSAPPPVASSFVSAAVTTVLAGSAYQYDIDTSDENGDPRTIVAVSAPAWATLTDNGDGTATLTGTPAGADAGSTAVSLTVNDGTFTTTQSFTLNVHTPMTAVLNGAVLTVHGTNSHDTIHVWSPKGRPEVMRVTMDDRIWNFTRSAVTGTEIYGYAGDDSIIANSNITAYANGGEGNDTLTGGDANDSLTGGMGNDTIEGAGGDDCLRGHGGDDSINAGDGNDRLYGNAGRDRLSGDAGRDLFDGGTGRDVFFSRDQTADVLIGDESDAAQADDADEISGVTTQVA
ncbi:MAG TPA: putative Ig domain-containing protein [Tepidisphaeraceae bacterium]